MAKSNEDKYQKKQKRFDDAVQLKVPDRVPIAPLFTFYTAKANGVSCEEVMYDLDKLGEISKKAILDYDLDCYFNTYGIIGVGKQFEMLGDKRFKWPGHGVDSHVTYQFVEGEHMSAEEYDEFIFDPTDFMLRKYIPRTLSALKPLEMLPNIPSVFYFMLNVALSAPFGTPDVAQAFETLIKTGQETLKLLSKSAEFEKEMTELGYPSMVGGLTQAPFDYIGDYLRGTRGIMLDMYKRPEKLMEALDKATPMMINLALGQVEMSGTRRVFIPLHKGLDGFMSPAQFNTFFWPGLKKVLVALIEKDIVPIVLWEGNCNTRLQTIADIPKGKAIYWFERTDMRLAKEMLHGKVCIMGLVPASLMIMATPQEVKDYAKKLIDVVGKDGGYILNGDIGIPDEAKPENVKALFDFTREYGVYR
jgi:uroporphyrinogen-III decarboxylase